MSSDTSGVVASVRSSARSDAGAEVASVTCGHQAASNLAARINSVPNSLVSHFTVAEMLVSIANAGALPGAHTIVQRVDPPIMTQIMSRNVSEIRIQIMTTIRLATSRRELLEVGEIFVEIEFEIRR